MMIDAERARQVAMGGDPFPRDEPSLEHPTPTPNRALLDWSDPDPKVDPSIWAVSFRRGDLQQAADAFERLKDDLGDVEDRFIHLRADGQYGITMFVLREETEGRALPDISSFAEVRQMRTALARLGAYAARMKDFWRDPPKRKSSRLQHLVDHGA